MSHFSQTNSNLCIWNWICAGAVSAQGVRLVRPGRVCLWFLSCIRAGLCRRRPDVDPAAAAAAERNPCQPYYWTSWMFHKSRAIWEPGSICTYLCMSISPHLPLVMLTRVLHDDAPILSLLSDSERTRSAGVKLELQPAASVCHISYSLAGSALKCTKLEQIQE